MTTLVFKTTDEVDSYFANAHEHLDKKDLKEYRWIFEEMMSEDDETIGKYNDIRFMNHYDLPNQFNEISNFFYDFCDAIGEVKVNSFQYSLYDGFFIEDGEDFDDLTDGLKEVIVKGDTQIARLNRLIDYLVKEKGEDEVLELIDSIYQQNHEYPENEILSTYFVEDVGDGEWKCWDAPVPDEERPSFEVISNIPIKGREKMDAGDLYSECEAFMEQWMEDNDKEDLEEFPYEYYDSVDGRLR
jgi:hypothetical protein